MPRRGRPRKRPFQSLYSVRDWIEYTSDSESDHHNIHQNGAQADQRPSMSAEGPARQAADEPQAMDEPEPQALHAAEPEEVLHAAEPEAMDEPEPQAPDAAEPEAMDEQEPQAPDAAEHEDDHLHPPIYEVSEPYLF